MTNQVIRVNPNFNDSDHYWMFDLNDFSPQHSTIIGFQKLAGAKFDDVIDLMVELPEGSFIAGGNFRKTILKESVKNYNIFFDSEQAFLSTVRRIQHAPEGTFLHGYAPKMSLKTFLESDLRVFTFSHPSKPDILLMRTRWYDSKDEIVNTSDLIDSAIVMDTSFNVSFHSDAIDSIKSRRARIMRVYWPVGTGQRILEREQEGFTYRSYLGNGSSERQDSVDRYNRFLQKFGQNADPRFRE